MPFIPHGGISASVIHVSEEITTPHIHVSDELQMSSGSRVSGSLIPMVTDNPDHSLGKPGLPWHDAYLSSGSLYIDEKRTLYADSGSVRMRDGVQIGPDDFMKILRRLRTKLNALENEVAAISGTL